MASRVRKNTKTVARALRNSLEVLRLGRLAPAQRTPFTSMRQESTYGLRRYAAQPGKPAVGAPVLLVPSLVLSSEIYDIEPSASAVSYLTQQGIDTWLCDFSDHGRGATASHDEHVRAIDECIELMREITGRDVHLLGYSQGGMLVYETAALRRCEGLRSVITLGAPVDVHQALPLNPDLFARAMELVRDGTLRELHRLERIPRRVASLAYNFMASEHGAWSFWRDPNGLSPLEPSRGSDEPDRWITSDGIAPWPGRSVRRFADEFVLSNRLLQGGFVAGGRVASLADLCVPLLYFVGTRDDIARPASVRAISRAATSLNELYEIALPTGHVGLVASELSFGQTWPSVVAWLRWREGAGPKPAELLGQKSHGRLEGALSELHERYTLVRDASSGVAQSIAHSLTRAVRDAIQVSETLRFQVARLARLEQLKPDTPISFGLVLSRLAEKKPDEAWFIYEGRGQTYADANRRVDHIVKGLIACGIRKDQHVGVLMQNRPSYLSLVTALSRLGAVSVLLSPDSERASLSRALELSPIHALVADPEHVGAARESFDGLLLMLGAPKSPRPNVRDVIDMEVIDTEQVALPAWYVPNPGRAEDLAMIMFTAGPNDEPWAARITHRRWAVAAYSTAAFASLTSKDTVYACTPLHHGSGLLVAASGALVGGARLALARRFVAEQFWPEVRRCGASVVFYTGEMLRPLLHLPSHRGEQFNPLRLVAGSGMRANTQQRLINRYASIRIVEFHASPEGPGVLGNLSSQKLGSLGQPLVGDDSLMLCAYDFEHGALLRDAQGRAIVAGDDEPGVLLARIDRGSAHATFDGYVQTGSDERVARNVQAADDFWFVTGDVMRRDPQGDYWLLDRMHDVIHAADGLEFTRPIEEVFYELSEVAMAAVYGTPRHARPQLPEAAVVLHPGCSTSAQALSQTLVPRLDDGSLPRVIRIVESLPMTDGSRPIKTALSAASCEQAALATFRYDESQKRYFKVSGEPRLRRIS